MHGRSGVFSGQCRKIHNVREQRESNRHNRFNNSVALNSQKTMAAIRLIILMLSLGASVMCTKPPEGPLNTSADGRSNQSKPEPKPGQGPQPGTLSYPVYTAEKDKEAKSLKQGVWVPVKIDRNYLILRGGGIRVEEGDYFVQLLSDPTGKVVKFVLAKKRGTRVIEIDINQARARDGSFATVLDFVGEVKAPAAHSETLAYVSSSGESGAVWVHLAGGPLEWRGELMGLAGPSSKLQVHQ